MHSEPDITLALNTELFSENTHKNTRERHFTTQIELEFKTRE